MDFFGLKWTIIIGEIAYIFYIAVNVQPTPILMYVAAASVGLVSAPFWASQATYVSRIARAHAHLQQKKVEDVVSLFFGIFFAIFGTCAVWGNLVSYVVLNQSNQPQRFNCGIYFDPLSKAAMIIPVEVSKTTVSSQTRPCSRSFSVDASGMFSVVSLLEWAFFQWFSYSPWIKFDCLDHVNSFNCISCRRRAFTF